MDDHVFEQEFAEELEMLRESEGGWACALCVCLVSSHLTSLVVECVPCVPLCTGRKAWSRVCFYLVSL